MNSFCNDLIFQSYSKMKNFLICSHTFLYANVINVIYIAHELYTFVFI